MPADADADADAAASICLKLPAEVTQRGSQATARCERGSDVTMANRLVVDLDVNGRVAVSTWLEGELPSAATESAEFRWPLDADDSEDLRWYLEDYLRAPFGVYEDRGSQVADRLPEWGEAMFSALFGTGPARDAYFAVRSRAVRPGAMEIILRSAAPAWLGLPWELLKDPGWPTPVALDGVAISRSLLVAQSARAFAAEGSKLRVLMVISRPRGTDDVGYQMISRPLLSRLAAVHGDIDLAVLRPPTLEALVETLREAHAAGSPFQIVHFDGHGVSADALAGVGAPGRDNQRAREGALLFEKPNGGAAMVPAALIGQVLGEAQVPVVVLNACQSGAVGEQLEATIATRLLAGGASAVVAMAYSIYAVAAAEFMTAFYERLFAGDTVSESVVAGRARMARRPDRPSPKGELPLADWVIPVHYLRREVHFPDLRIQPAARVGESLDVALDALRVSRASHQDELLAPVGEFVGRDGLFYSLEVAARTQRVVIMHGPGGTGKSELAKAFGRWWRDTGGVDRAEWVIWHSFEPGVASFGLDGVVSAIGFTVYGSEFALQDPATRLALVHQLLREHRLLIVWDNFESVCSMSDSTSATPPLDAAARNELREFLHRVAASGRSALLVTSRTPEAWLGDLRRIELGGLSPKEAVEYADQVLSPFPATLPRRASRAFAELLEQLEGHPLSMRLLLPHLDNTDSADLLAGLRGSQPLPAGFDDDRTTSLSACIKYSINHLDLTARRLLAAVSLCIGVADADILSRFSSDDQVPDRFRGVDAHGWTFQLRRAAAIGILTELGEGMYGIHPALPAYLAEQWHSEDSGDYSANRTAAERALLKAYTELGAWLSQQVKSGDAALAYQIIGRQRRMLGYMVGLALEQGRWSEAQAILEPMNSFWMRGGLTVEARGWFDRTQLALEEVEGNSPSLNQPAGALWLFATTAYAYHLQIGGNLKGAEASYIEIQKRLLAKPDSHQQRWRLASIYYQLGMVTQLRGQLDEAEEWYRKSLAIAEDLDDRSAKSYAYHELGMVAQSRGRLDEAENWYKKSLILKGELGDRPAMSSSYHQLGTVAKSRGRLDEAELWYRETLAIAEDLDDKPRMSYSYHQLGMVMQKRGRLDEAEEWYRKSLAIKGELGDRRGLSSSYHQLGIVAQLRGRLNEAERWYRESLNIDEELEDRPRMAMALGQLGLLAEQRGALREALQWIVRCVALFNEFPHPETGPGPKHLIRLTDRLGIRTLVEVWASVTGVTLPIEVKKFVQTSESVKESNE
ncbi:tetratricopeptide repeat protein [Amycolatopsis sp. NPDC098790]|uniref:CHAT domain-containing tetratricopeptide repeat protein n=1 Tax=Amycolatopsis sp. NPDC098790 TaxID=3363939 RepID=UPI003809DCDE